MPRNRLSRRRAVQLSGSLFVAGLAGCPGDPNGAETAMTETGGDATTAGGTETGAASDTRTATPEGAETVTTDTESPADGSPETETSGTGTPPTDSPTRTPSGSAPASVTPAVSASEQETGGETITVERVAVDRPGWLVVHPAAGGGPDASTYFAAVPLDPGQSTDLEVTLERSLADDQTLYAGLHYDDPHDGNFTFAPGRGDDPPVVVDGETVVDSFRVTVA